MVLFRPIRRETKAKLSLSLYSPQHGMSGTIDMYHASPRETLGLTDITVQEEASIGATTEHACNQAVFVEQQCIL